MKLRNKQTGEIKDVESLGHEKSLRDKYGPQITLSWNTEYENLGECRTYNSLAELNAEWEDYEEPKEYFYIYADGDIYKDVQDDLRKDNGCKDIGNYFSTREEAEKAVEKLKAFKRLRDNGIRFRCYMRRSDWAGLSEVKALENIIDITAYLPKDKTKEMKKDLDLLFGGEE